VPRPTQVPSREPHPFRLRGFHPLWPAFPVPFDYVCGFLLHYLKALQPQTQYAWFGLLPVRSPLLRESLLTRVNLDFYSSRYLDGSVPWVLLRHAYIFSAR
jgi:hypothetical protein